MIKQLKQIMRLPEQQVLTYARQILLSKGYTNIIKSPQYLLAQGEIPIALVAHADTVFDTPPTHIFYDSQQQILWSPQGLGADDRAGIYAILSLASLKPHILITTGEESGCTGATAFTQAFPKFPFPLHFFIQLDRRGSQDSVYYSCGNASFQSYINSFGFTTASGSFTDITVLSPQYGIASTNLSVGYYREHSPTEFLSTYQLRSTIRKVGQILSTPSKFYPYQENTIPCFNCRKPHSPQELIPIVYPDHRLHSLCVDCFVEKTKNICYYKNDPNPHLKKERQN